MVMVAQDRRAARYFSHRSDDLQSLSSNVVNSIAVDSNGVLWVATAGGVDRFEPDNGSFLHLQGDTGIGALVAIVDRQNTLWVGTDGAGLVTFDPETETLTKVYDEDNGAGIVLSLYEDRNGIIWAGTDGEGL